MPLYKVQNGRLEAVQATSFTEERVFERKDLQQLLKADISPLGDDLMVLAEEYGNWEDSKRRIDLLCLDKQARLVVVELKRTEDGGHMELQAIRYAAMISSMTLDQAISTYAKYLGGEDAETKATKDVLEFLEEDSVDDVELTKDVRIILVSGDFSSELTTAVIWLNKHDLDITCVRLKPYKLGDSLLIDTVQIIPLPEAADYEVKIRGKEQEAKKVQTARQEIFRRFWAQLIDRSKSKTPLLANRSTTTDHWLSAGIGRYGFSLNLTLTENRARVECYIRNDKEPDDWNLKALQQLKNQRESIEQAFGAVLFWDELPGRKGCRIHFDQDGGWRNPESEWVDMQDQMVDSMIRLEGALRNPIHQIKV
ncbi:DUF4268 domain-containing protein [Thiobacillus sp.]